MRKLVTLGVLLLCLTAVSCSSLPAQIPETMKEACSLYQNVRPDVLKAREYAKTHWNFIPSEMQEVLLKIDAYLPELDRAGVTICAASDLIARGQKPSRVNWDDVLSTVVKAAAFAADLKGRGVI